MMKTNIYVFTLLFLAWGCSDFLKESSQDEVRPSTVNDLEQILLGDGYVNKHNFYYCTEVFTDNVQSNGVNATYLQAAHDKDKWKYSWSENMFTEAGGGYDAAFWQSPYEGILGCNLLLDNLDNMKGDDRLRENLRGEALALRSWYYLHLVNFFGVAYNQGDPKTDFGVPLKLNSSVTGEFFTRNTVGEVYAQIEKDLLEANRLLKKYDFDRNYFRMNHLAAKAILSRVYLYMENWDQALAYADSVLLEKSDLLDLNTLNWQGITSTYTDHGGVYNVNTADEIIWKRTVPLGFASNTVPSPFTISDDLSEMYEGGTQAEYRAGQTRDVRGFVSFYWGMNYSTNFWFRQGGGKQGKDWGADHGIRTAELYLNRAEVYVRKYISEGNESYRKAALADLNELRRHRFNKKFPFVEAEMADGKALLDFCLAERRRELCAETNHRWCDVRRLGVTVRHLLVETGNTEYTKDMSRYALPIPEYVLECNPSLRQNQ